MPKQYCVVSAPISTYSGYGKRSVDFIKELIKHKGDDWDIRILAQRWGDTRQGYLEDHNENDLISRCIQVIDRAPDVFIQISVPNEFKKVGRFNIGVTAGIETTLADSSWIEGCNNMDLIIVPSQHSKTVLESSVYNVVDKQTGQPISQIKLKTPIEILFEGIDTDVYKVSPSAFNLDEIKESSAALIVGHWLPGDFNEDRKNIGGTIKTFLQAFQNKKNAPALLIKTQIGGTTWIGGLTEIKNRIEAIKGTIKGTVPNVYLIYGDLSDSEMNSLYNHPKVKAMISLTKGEGFGRPLLEFSNVNKPIIASNWSGHLDFLQSENTKLIHGTLTQVHPSAVMQNAILPDSQWFTFDVNFAIQAIRDVWDNYEKTWKIKAKKQGYYTRSHFTKDLMGDSLVQLLTRFSDKFVPIVELNLEGLSLDNLPKKQ